MSESGNDGEFFGGATDGRLLAPLEAGHVKNKEEVAVTCELLMRSSKVGASPPWEANAKQQELVQEEPCMETLGARPKHGHGAVASIGALIKQE